MEYCALRCTYRLLYGDIRDVNVGAVRRPPWAINIIPRRDWWLSSDFLSRARLTCRAKHECIALTLYGSGRCQLHDENIFHALRGSEPPTRIGHLKSSSVQSM